MADPVGRVLGARYRLVRSLGSGASAEVFLAEDAKLGRQVAVKVLHPHLAKDESFLRRFRDEAQRAARLNHPNVMNVLDTGESDNEPYLVLEYLAGGSLRDLLRAGSLLSPAQAARVGLEAARGLNHAHQRGLVHRDVKPANLLFDEDGRLRIADFGVAKALVEAGLTEPGGPAPGTPLYASPEQAHGDSVGGKADVYSLALVLVESVTGRVPFSADTPVATMMGRVGAHFEAPPELGSLGPVVGKAAHPDPPARLDAAEVVSALEEVVSRLPPPEPLPLAPPPTLPHAEVGDTEVIRVDGGTASPGVTDIDDITVVPSSRDDDRGAAGEVVPGLVVAPARRRRRWPWVVLMVVVAVLGAGAAFVLAQANVPEHPVPALRGKTLAEARAEVADERFELKVGRPRFDEAVPADVIIEQDPSPLRSLKEGRSVTVVVSKGPAPRAVPDLAGLDQAAAEQKLTESGFVPKVVLQPHEEKPKGTVLTWSPTGVLPKGIDVTVTVSSGPAPREVPEVAGKTYDEAAAVLAAQGLKAERADVFSSDVAKGAVVSTRPGAGKAVERDSTVTVNVSKGPDTVAVPDVLGKTVAEATAILEAAGLQVSGTGGKPRSQRVFLTDPQAGTQVPRGSGVFLFVR